MYAQVTIIKHLLTYYQLMSIQLASGVSGHISS